MLYLLYLSVSCTLMFVVRVIHTLRNFVFQSQLKNYYGIFRILGDVFTIALQTRDNQESLVVAVYNQIKSGNCQDLVKI